MNSRLWSDRSGVTAGTKIYAADFIGVEQDGRRAGIFHEYGVQARLDERGDVLVRQPRLYNPPSSRDGSSTARLESEYRNYYR